MATVETKTSTLNLLVDARKIDVLMHRGYTEADFARFGEPPDPLEGFFTFFDPGLPLGVFADAKTTEGKIFPETPGLRKDQPYATQAERGRYRQLQMVPAQRSIGKAVGTFALYLAADEVFPSPRTIAIAKMIYFLANQGAKLWEKLYIPSDAYDPKENQIIVGGFLHIVTEVDRFNRSNMALISEKILK